MFVLVWATLLFASWRSSANAGTPSEETDPCQHGSCISLKVQIAAEITTEAGHSVVLPCSFTATENVTANNINWYKCEQSEQTCTKSLLESNNAKFKGRVSRMKPDCNKNCSIIIRNVTKSDSGFYQLRVHGGFSRTNVQSILSNQTKVPVTDLRQKVTVMIRQLTTGKQTTLTCTAPVDPPQSVYEITWTWNGKRITGNQTVSQGHTSNWTFNLSAEHHDTQVTCKVNFTGNIITEETVTLNVSGIKKSEISEQISTQTNDVELPMKFLNSSGCQKMSRVLTCECIVEGSPIANITWPLLQNYAEYSVITTVSNYTVRSAVTVTVTDDMNSEVECVSMSNKTKEIKLKISKKPQEDIVKKLLKFVTQLEIIVAFFTDVNESKISEQISTQTNYVELPMKFLNSSGCQKTSKVLTCECIEEDLP
ncbi:hypothetical protein Q5P01_011588 [Channa striata]|uniref:Ig-like domain-containing protein n=1 Tax=Channa striata TaxID=64152 RepID=A0AA88MV42_CHASR|nr:hypothetical protein Q5P01_011588 [Channa striata]